jgi:hypothetical protein
MDRARTRCIPPQQEPQTLEKKLATPMAVRLRRPRGLPGCERGGDGSEVVAGRARAEATCDGAGAGRWSMSMWC